MPTLTAKGKMPTEEFTVWLEADSVSETARRYTLMLEGPDAPVGPEKPFTAVTNIDAPSTLTAVFATDANGTHEVPIV